MCRCRGNHQIASVVLNGLNSICSIVRDYGGSLSADLEMVGRDLEATVLARELRYLTVQAFDSSIRAMWALTVKGNRYVLLAPESIPPVAALRRAQWRVVLFRRHLVPTLDEEVLACARLEDEGDLSRRWELAGDLAGPERRSGVVVHMPYRDKPGVVHSTQGNAAEPVELELARRDARCYAHCRGGHHHPAGQAEPKCADLRRGDPITYVPMLRFPSRIPVAFLTSRDPHSPRPHPSGIGYTPIR